MEWPTWAGKYPARERPARCVLVDFVKDSNSIPLMSDSYLINCLILMPFSFPNPEKLIGRRQKAETNR